MNNKVSDKLENRFYAPTVVRHQLDIYMMTSFNYNYQNALRQAIVFSIFVSATSMKLQTLYAIVYVM